VIRVVLAALGMVLALWLTLGALARGPAVFRLPPAPGRRSVSVERLEASVLRLCGDLAPRNFTAPESLERCADWIASRFRRAGLDVRAQRYSIREGEFRNVLGVRPGTDPSRGLTIVGAHYDAFFQAPPGADDNASAVAVLLELADTLPEEPPRGTQVFAAFVNEEPPFFSGPDMGSARYARSLAEEGARVELMIALDLVGYFSDEPGSQSYPAGLLRPFYPSRGDFIAVVGDLGAGRWIRRVKRGMRSAGTIPVRSFRGPRLIPGIDWSDHYWFRRLGLPGVLVTDTAYLRNPNYHLPSDTPETLDYERMAALVQALHGVLALE
jgi:Zn-dependent M28 family amino/carboxypeptidase